MEDINKQKLIELFIEWFNLSNFDQVNFFAKDKFGSILKEKLKIKGRWKDKQRGDPAKGKKQQEENRSIDLRSGKAGLIKQPNPLKGSEKACFVQGFIQNNNENEEKLIKQPNPSAPIDPDLDW